MRIKHNLRRLLLCLCAFLCWQGCDTADNVEDPDLHYFVKYYGGDGNQYGVDMVPLQDGSILLLGNNTVNISKTNLYLLRVDAEGSVLWEKQISGNEASSDELMIWDAKDLEPTLDGNFVLVADVRRPGELNSRDVKLFKISPDGVLLDSVGYGNEAVTGAKANDYSQSVTPLSDGGFIVSGHTELTATFLLSGETDPDLGDIFNFRVDANLDPLTTNDWSPAIHGFGSNMDVAVKSVEREDGTFYVFGHTNSTLTGSLNPNQRQGLFYFVRGTSGSLGNVFYPGNIVNVNDTEIRYVGSVPAELGGGFVVVGTSTGGLAQSDVFFAKMRSSLTFSSKENDASFYNTISLGRNVRAISASPSVTGEFGYLILGNEVRPNATNIWLSKINQNGNVLWSTTLGSELENDSGAAVAQLPDGKILIFGSMGLADNQSKMALIKLNPQGHFLK